MSEPEVLNEQEQGDAEPVDPMAGLADFVGINSEFANFSDGMEDEQGPDVHEEPAPASPAQPEMVDFDFGNGNVQKIPKLAADKINYEQKRASEVHAKFVQLQNQAIARQSAPAPEPEQPQATNEFQSRVEKTISGIRKTADEADADIGAGGRLKEMTEQMVSLFQDFMVQSDADREAIMAHQGSIANQIYQIGDSTRDLRDKKRVESYFETVKWASNYFDPEKVFQRARQIQSGWVSEGNDAKQVYGDQGFHQAFLAAYNEGPNKTAPSNGNDPSRSVPPAMTRPAPPGMVRTGPSVREPAMFNRGERTGKHRFSKI